MKKKQSSSTAKETSDKSGFVIMNKEIYTEKPESEGILWGWVLIFSGLLLLLNIFEVVPWEIWYTFLRFWPVLIILAGVQMILGGSRIARAFFGILVFFLFGWIILVALNESSPELIDKLPDFLKQPIKWWEVVMK